MEGGGEMDLAAAVATEAYLVAYLAAAWREERPVKDRARWDVTFEEEAREEKAAGWDRAAVEGPVVVDGLEEAFVRHAPTLPHCG